MMTLEEIQVALRHHKIGKVAEAVGINRTSIAAIMKDRCHEPRYSTVKALSDYLKANAVVG